MGTVTLEQAKSTEARLVRVFSWPFPMAVTHHKERISVSQGEHEALSLLQWAWAVLTLPLAWMWGSISTLRKDLSDHKVKSAEQYMTKTEIHHAINEAVGPIREDTKEIKADVKALLNRQNGWQK